MKTNRHRWLWLAAVLCAGTALAWVTGLPAPAAHAQPRGNVFVYLPFVVKPITISALELHANTTLDCASAYQANGPSPLVISGQASRFETDVHISADSSHTYRFNWTRNGQPWYNDGPWPISGDPIFSSPTSDNHVPCRFPFSTGTYVVSLYVDSVFQESGTIIYQ